MIKTDNSNSILYIIHELKKMYKLSLVLFLEIGCQEAMFIVVLSSIVSFQNN
jgi:hypothetical protein